MAFRIIYIWFIILCKILFISSFMAKIVSWKIRIVFYLDWCFLTKARNQNDLEKKSLKQSYIKL